MPQIMKRHEICCSLSIRFPVIAKSLYEPKLYKLIQANYEKARATFFIYMKESKDIPCRLASLHSVLPTLPPSPKHIVTCSEREDDPFFKSSFAREARPIQALGLPFGFFGTFINIYNQVQI